MSDCTLCTQAGFSRGAELFDPMILPLLPRLDAVTGVAFTWHMHKLDTELVYKLSTALYLPPPAGFIVRFDVAGQTDAAAVVDAALRAIDSYRQRDD